MLCFEAKGTCEEERDVEQEGADNAHDDVNPVAVGGWVMMDKRGGKGEGGRLPWALLIAFFFALDECVGFVDDLRRR